MAKQPKVPINRILEEIRSIVGKFDLGNLQSNWAKDLNTLDNINKVMELFTLKNLPDTYSERYIKLLLITRGALMAFNHPILGKMILPFSRQGGLNPLGFMTKARPIAQGGDVSLLGNAEYEIGKDCEIIRCNSLEVPIILYCDFYGKKLTDLLNLIKKNNVWCKFPVVLKSSGDVDKDKKNALVVKDFISEDGLQAPIITDSLNGIDIINVKSQYLGAELIQQYKEFANLFYEFLGVNHHEEKKERLTNDEVNFNTEMSNINSSKLVKPLTDSINAVNKVLSWNLDVEFNFADTRLYNIHSQQVNLTQGVK